MTTNTNAQVMQQALDALERNVQHKYPLQQREAIALGQAAIAALREAIAAHEIAALKAAQPVEAAADAEAVMKWLDVNCRRVSWNIDGASFEITDDQAFALVNFFTTAQPAKSALKSLLNKLDSRIGVHPLSVNGVPRTERKNGWNDCSTQVSAICDEVNESIAQPVQPAEQDEIATVLEMLDKHAPFTAGSLLARVSQLCLITPAAQPVQPAACKPLCDQCVTLGYNACANTAKTTPIFAQQVQPAKQQNQDALDAGEISVDRGALVELLNALNGPAHLIREIQMTRNISKFTQTPHPIETLMAQVLAHDAAIAARGAKS